MTGLNGAPTEILDFEASHSFFGTSWPMVSSRRTPFGSAQVFASEPVVMSRTMSFNEMDPAMRAQFEAFCKDAPVMSGQGWYAPYMVNRQAWLDFGGLM